MKRRILTLLLVAALALSLGMTSAWAQEDLAKSLVGKWEGAAVWAGSAGSAMGDPNRTLIIESVTQKDGKPVATGKYGVTGKGLGKVEIEVEESASRPTLRFVTGGQSTVRLTLTGAKELTGTLSLVGTSQRGNERPLRLEKKD